MKKGLISRGGCLPYDPKLVDRSRYLRRNMTPAEQVLWYQYLRKHKNIFHRQKIIDHYIVDFYCSEALLVIEIDGATHYTDDGIEYDVNRTAILEEYGIKVVRFTNVEIHKDFVGVCLRIEQELEMRSRDKEKKKPPNPL